MGEITTKKTDILSDDGENTDEEDVRLKIWNDFFWIKNRCGHLKKSFDNNNNNK